MTWVVLVVAATGLVAAAGVVRHPGIIAAEPWPAIVFCALAFLVLATTLGLALSRRSKRTLPAAAIVSLLVLAAFGRAAFLSERTGTVRSHVLAEPAPELRAVAAHVIAGFTTMEDARALARAGIAGLFFSPRNVRGRTIEAIARDIAELQALRRAAHLPPLWIAADQEGGVVANMSPPLPRPPSLASVASDPRALVADVDAIGVSLRGLGVNLDFAPVVDVGRGRVDPADRNTRIAMRAISSDPAEVVRVADIACRRLAAANIRCTIKHFPGIGAASGDTHVESSHLPTIAAVDLAPFMALTRPEGPHPWVMLSHVVIDDLDPRHPSSASAAVVAVLRRGDAKDDILITDDASMAAYRTDLAGNTVATLKSGADIILASYDPDTAFAVLAILLDRTRSDPDLRSAIHASDARLRRAVAAMP